MGIRNEDAGRKSDRSADASEAESQASFSLPEKAPGSDRFKKTVFVAQT